MQAGGGAQTGSAARWGDYTMLSVDPADDVTFWYVNEYYPATAAVAWHTRIGSFRLGSAQQGVVRGVVTNALTGEPIAGAQVSTSIGFVTPTLSNGLYALALGTGTVNLTATALDYEPSASVPVLIELNVTTEQNFALSPIPLRIVPQAGLSASGLEGGPFAPAGKTYVLTNASLASLTWTAEVNVAWAEVSLRGGTLAAGAATTLVVSINYSADFMPTGTFAGQLSLSNLTAGTGQQRSLGLVIAPYQETIFCEDFEAGLPADWQVRTNGAQVSTAAWRFDSPGGRANLTGGAGTYAAVDDDLHGATVLTDTELISAEMNLAGLSAPVLEFKTNFRLDSGEVVDVDVSTNGLGGPWSTIWSRSASYSGVESVSLASFAGATNLHVRFHYMDNASWGWWWQVDDVCVKGVFLPDSGDLVVKPLAGFAVSGYAGGPFPLERVYRLTNGSVSSLSWSATPDVVWAEVVPASGTLAGQSQQDVTVRVSAAASALSPDLYTGSLVFSNLTQALAQSRTLQLEVLEPLQVTPLTGYAASGLEGGPFTPASVVYGVSNASAQAIHFSAAITSAWFNLSSTGGVLVAGGATALTGTLTTAALVIPGLYGDALVVSNQLTGGLQTRTAVVTVVEIRGDIAVYDSVAPTNDLQVPFGTVAPYAVATQFVTVVNSDPPGGRDLTIQNIYLGFLTETFDDGYAQGWREDAPANWTVVGGSYLAQAPGADFLTSVYTDSVARADVSIEALCSRVGDTGYAQGLAVRASDDFDADGVGRAYLFVVDGSNAFAVFWADGLDTDVLQGWTLSTALLAGQTNRLVASVEGTTLRFFINNTLVWSGDDSRLAAGRVALVGYDDGASQPAYSFDGVQVQTPRRPVAGVGRKQLYFNSLAQENSEPTGPARASYTPPVVEPGGPVEPLAPGADAAPFAITNLPATPVTLTPGSSFGFEVRYAPTALGTNRNVVTLHSDDNEEPFVQVELSGRVAQGAITGLITSATTGAGLGGALVTANNGITNWTAISTGAGAYRLPVLAGTYDVIAQLSHYTTGSLSGVVVSDQADTAANFVLAGSELTYAPTGMTVVLNYGQQQTNTVWLTNSGPLDISVQLAARVVQAQGPVRIAAFTGSIPVSAQATSLRRDTNTAKRAGQEAPGFAAPTRRLCYGVNLDAGTLVSFYTDAPETLTTIGSTGANLIPCVDFLNYDISQLYALDMDANNLVRISVASGAVTVVGPATPAAGQSWTGLAAAPDGTLYAASTDGASSKLYTLQPNTGAATFVGNITGAAGIIALACDAAGQLYGLDISGDNLVLVNAATGAGTVIGSVGFDANFAQGMDFDEADNVLYLAAYNATTSRGELRTADLNTGNTTLIGVFQGGAELCMAVVSDPRPAWISFPTPTSAIPAATSTSAPVVFDTTPLANRPSTNLGEVVFAGNFINAPPRLPVTLVVVPDALGVLPFDQVISSGPAAGPFTPAAHVFTCTNWSGGAITWTVTNNVPWITLSTNGGLLSAGAGVAVTATLNAAASALPLGVYTARLHFVNATSGMTQEREVRLAILDYFTELFTFDNDLDYRMLTFTPRMGAPYYTVCSSNAVAAFPTDPTGGSALSLADDGSAEIAFAGGLQVPFYGVARGTLFVGSNGYITFGSGDDQYSESLENHFVLPRLSLLFDDLDPTSGGTISWKQLADRVAVTWQNVPQYGQGDQNSFQVELFSNGVLRLTWLGLGAVDGLAGLSQGLGTPADFMASDLSAYVTCALQDSDADGMADVWETANGLLVGVNDATNNPDGDAWINAEEFVADASPTASNEPLRVMVLFVTNGLGVSAGPVTTNSRQYDLEATTNLLQTGWWPVQSNLTGAGNGGVLLLNATNAGPSQALAHQGASALRRGGNEKTRPLRAGFFNHEQVGLGHDNNFHSRFVS
jgi:hypothetical protein